MDLKGFFYLRSMKIKEEIVKVCGEATGNLFSNTQGPVNTSELRAKLSFSEIVEAQPKVFSAPFEKIVEYCEAENIQGASEFLKSYQDFIGTTYAKNASLCLIEENYGNTQYKTLIKDKAVEVYTGDKKNFNKEAVRQITENPPVGVFFKDKILNSEDATDSSTEDLKEKIALLAQVGIMNSMMKKFKSLRSKPVNQFETFFNEDSSNMTNSIMHDIQSNGIL